jgi:hypothetical protein
MNNFRDILGQKHAVLPNFFILGAAKSGTTSLHDLLKQCPQVYFPFSKEPMFFSQDALYVQGLDWYAKTFYAGSKTFPLRGDATPHYLYWGEKVAPRLKQAYPEAPKMIIVLRDPVSRAYSWYWNMVREGNETLSFEAALEAEDSRLKTQHNMLQAKGSMLYGYVRGSQYLNQIRHFMEFFSKDRFLFILHEDLSSTRLADTLGKVKEFFGLSEYEVPTQSTFSNPASLPRSMSLQRWLRHQSAFREYLKRFIPYRVRYFAKENLIRLNLRQTTYPQMGENTRQQLQSRFAGEIMALQELLGRDLSGWLRS